MIDKKVNVVHADTHPSGHPNKTAVNPENPIFGRPADPIPEVSFQQAAVVQSEKHPRETVQSPLLSEDVANSSLSLAECLGVVDEEFATKNTESLPEQSAEEVAAIQQAEQAQDSSPSAEDLDAVAAETAAKEATSETVSESFRERDDNEVDPVAEENTPQDSDPVGGATQPPVA